VTVTTVKAEQGPPARQTLFGHIKSLETNGGGFVMRFDPEWFLSGSTANPAAAEDGAVEPGQPVPSDNYRVDEGHRLFTYKVSADAHLTVITKAPTGTPITVSQLAAIVNGTSKLKLFDVRAARERCLDRRLRRHRPLDRPAVPAIESQPGTGGRSLTQTQSP
jgi:hypothetical protein